MAESSFLILVKHPVIFEFKGFVPDGSFFKLCAFLCAFKNQGATIKNVCHFVFPESADENIVILRRKNSPGFAASVFRCCE
jgi:hypothetical protein